MDDAQTVVESFLYKKYQNESSYSVMNQTQMLETANETASTLALMLGGIAGISLLVGGIGIMNIMLVSVTERTREIGIRKAIGAKRRDILLQFLIESVVISGMGGLLGLAFGYALMHVLETALGMTLRMSLSVAYLAIGFSMTIGVVFGLYPANKASKLRPIEALHYSLGGGYGRKTGKPPQAKEGAQAPARPADCPGGCAASGARCGRHALLCAAASRADAA